MFSDGGFRELSGAAYAIFLVDVRSDCAFHLAIVDALYVHRAETAFAMEVVAAERAIEAVIIIKRLAQL